MPLKLEEGKKYTPEELEKMMDEEVKMRLGARGANRRGPGRKGRFNAKGAGLADFDTPEMPEELQVKADEIYLASKLLRRNPRELKMWNKFEAQAGEFIKAMDTETVGEGLEWVPTGLSNQLIASIRLALKVGALHRHISMPSKSYILPIEGGEITVKLVTESTSDTPTKFTASTPGTVKVTLTAVKMAGRVLASVEEDEDSAIPVIPYIREKLIKGLAGAIEDATINGDTAGTHIDSDVTDADDHRKGWNGYRKVALTAAKIDLSTFNVTNLRAVRTAMGKYGVTPGDLAWIAGVKAYDKMLGLDECLTIEKYGPMATILKGELAKLFGIPVIVSDKIRENLNASGVYDGITTDKSVLPLVYKPGFVFGDRRSVQVRVLRELYAESDQNCVVATQRGDFKPVYDTTTEPIVALGYNIG